MDKIADGTQFAFSHTFLYLRIIFFLFAKWNWNTKRHTATTAELFFVLSGRKKVFDFNITHTPTSNAKGEGLSCVLSAVCLFAFGSLFSLQQKNMPRLY